MTRRAGRFRLIAVTLTVCTVALVPAWVGASEGSGVSGEILARGTGDIRVRAHGDDDVVVQRVTLQPGGFTGWHTHPGPLIAVVESGTLTHYDRHCEVDAVYEAGAAFVEPAGRRYVHQGVNLGSTDVVLAVTYIVPAGGPLREEVEPPDCE